MIKLKETIGEIVVNSKTCIIGIYKIITSNNI